MRYRYLLIPLMFPMLASAEEVYQLYSRPEVPTAAEADYGKSCALLEQEIASLLPLTYSTKPAFDKDPYVGTAATVGTIAFPVALTYLAYPVAFDHIEQDQIGDATLRIEALRKVKASKHCFED
jgi:hypothetical protein